MTEECLLCHPKPTRNAYIIWLYCHIGYSKPISKFKWINISQIEPERKENICSSHPEHHREADEPYWWNFVNRTHANTISYANFHVVFLGLLSAPQHNFCVCTDYFRRDDFSVSSACEWKIVPFCRPPSPPARLKMRKLPEKKYRCCRAIDCDDGKTNDNARGFHIQSQGRNLSNQLARQLFDILYEDNHAVLFGCFRSLKAYSVECEIINKCCNIESDETWSLKKLFEILNRTNCLFTSKCQIKPVYN